MRHAQPGRYTTVQPRMATPGIVGKGKFPLGALELHLGCPQHLTRALASRSGALPTPSAVEKQADQPTHCVGLGWGHLGSDTSHRGTGIRVRIFQLLPSQGVFFLAHESSVSTSTKWFMQQAPRYPCVPEPSLSPSLAARVWASSLPTHSHVGDIVRYECQKSHR